MQNLPFSFCFAGFLPPHPPLQTHLMMQDTHLHPQTTNFFIGLQKAVFGIKHLRRRSLSLQCNNSPTDSFQPGPPFAGLLVLLGLLRLRERSKQILQRSLRRVREERSARWEWGGNSYTARVRTSPGCVRSDEDSRKRYLKALFRYVIHLVFCPSSNWVCYRSIRGVLHHVVRRCLFYLAETTWRSTCIIIIGNQQNIYCRCQVCQTQSNPVH